MFGLLLNNLESVLAIGESCCQRRGPEIERTTRRMGPTIK